MGQVLHGSAKTTHVIRAELQRSEAPVAQLAKRFGINEKTVLKWRKRGPRTDNRLFMDALLWMARSGGRWRDLPQVYGDYRTVKRRYYDWIERGVLGAILEALSQEADLEWLCIDSTVIRAHSQAAGARLKRGA